MAIRKTRRGQIKELTLSHDDKMHLSQMLQGYLQEELDQELGRFEVEFLVDHLAKYMGPLFYNMGVLDGRALLEKQMEDLSDAFYGLERPIDKRS